MNIWSHVVTSCPLGGFHPEKTSKGLWCQCWIMFDCSLPAQDTTMNSIFSVENDVFLQKTGWHDKCWLPRRVNEKSRSKKNTCARMGCTSSPETPGEEEGGSSMGSPSRPRPTKETATLQTKRRRIITRPVPMICVRFFNMLNNVFLLVKYLRYWWWCLKTPLF